MTGLISFSKIIPIIDIENVSLKNESPGFRYIKYQKLHFIISFLFGLNRFYILNCNRIITGFCFVYTFGLLIYSTFVGFGLTGMGRTITLLRYSFSMQFAALSLNAYVFGRKHLKKYYKTLHNFDVMLKIKNRQIHTFRTGWLFFSFTSEFVDYYYLTSEYYGGKFDYISLVSLMWLINRDAEVMLCLNNLRHLYERVVVLKVHVLKIFDAKRSWCEREDKKLRKMEQLCRRVDLDLGALHQAYETLARCSEYMNRLLFIPFLTIFLTNAVTIIFSVKGTVKAIQSPETAEILDIRTNWFTAAFSIFRSIKYIMIIVLPAYLTSIAKFEVSAIRGILYDVVRSNRLDPTSQKRTKALLALVKNSDFSYVMIKYKMDMTLPLRFLHVCLTYFIIVMNFSRFID